MRHAYLFGKNSDFSTACCDGPVDQNLAIHAAMVEPEVTCCQEPKVTMVGARMELMVTSAKDFAMRLNEALDDKDLPSKHAGRQVLVAKMFGVSQKGARKWLEGIGYPTTHRAREIAKRLGVRYEWLMSGIGEKRSILEPSSEPAPSFDGTATPIRSYEKDVPLLISWAQAGDWIEHYQSFNAENAEDWLACPVAHGKRTFALWVQGISMEPDYHDGEVIFVDPDVVPESRNAVVARMNGNKFTFKQIVMDEFGNAHLRARNPQWNAPIIEVNDEVEIVGTVIFAGRFTTKRLHPRGESL
ncbi:MAG: S24 family peptidase [Gammaproteobacteria bacterium]